MSNISSDSIIYKGESILSAPPALVWELLTNSTYTQQYFFGCKVTSDFAQGSRIEFENEERIQVVGTIREVVPGKILDHTVFDPEMGIPDLPENYLFVRYELIPQDGNTLLKVSQGDFAVVADGEKRYADIQQGWPFIFQALQDMAQKVK